MCGRVPLWLLLNMQAVRTGTAMVVAEHAGCTDGHRRYDHTVKRAGCTDGHRYGCC